MTRVETLRDQALALCALAASFDDQTIRADLVRLAERCEALALRIEHSIREALSQPIDPRGGRVEA